MSTSAVSSSSIFQELQSFYQTRQSDLKQLGSALQSGDLAGAQQAYSALAALGQDGPFANSEPFSKSGKAQAFDAVGQALQAGDLAGAQTAFSSLTSSSQSNSSSPTDASFVTLNSTQTNSASPTDSASSIYQQLQAFREQRKTALAQLGQALQSGDLAGAQTAFDALTALGTSGPNKDGQPYQQAGRASDFQAIGEALQSGDLAGAQSAFTTLAGTFGKQDQQTQSAITAYNGNAPEIVVNFLSSLSSSATSPTSSSTQATAASTTSGSPQQAAPEIVINLGPGGASSSNPESVTINLSNTNSGEQVSVSESQGQTGSSAEQVTLNLSQQNNYELVLNLFNSGSASQAQSNWNGAVSLQA